MPEGDTIHKLAVRMTPMLVGRTLRRVTTQGLVRSSLEERTVTDVRAVGKHLLISTDDGTEIRTHLGMNGRWRRYPPGVEPPVSPGRASLVMFTDDDTLVCLMAKTVEIAGRRAPNRGAAVARLGPDLLAPGFEPATAAVRARAEGARPIGEVLLDQGVAAGIGNVYRSEVLFLERVHPGTPTSALDDAALAAMFQRARDVMSRNLGPGMRTTAPGEGPRYYVYGRTRLPCLVCRTAIEAGMDRTVRRAYWCPQCQPLVKPR